VSGRHPRLSLGKSESAEATNAKTAWEAWVQKRGIFGCLGAPAVCMGPLMAAKACAAALRDRDAASVPRGVWMALYLQEVADKALGAGAGDAAHSGVTGVGARGAEGGAGTGIEKRKRFMPTCLPPAIHSREYVLAHVAHSTAAAAAGLGRTNDAYSLLKYAQEVGDTAAGPPDFASSRVGDAEGPKVSGKGNATTKRRSPPPLPQSITGILAHASAHSKEGRKAYGSAGSGARFFTSLLYGVII
jgi:hypothetical protein